MTKKKPETRKLVAVALDNLPQDVYRDHIFIGLTLHVGVNRKTWKLRHRVGTKHRNDILGYYPKMKLAEARTAARAMADRAEIGAPLEPAPVHPKKGGITVEDVIDRYEKMRLTMAKKAEPGTKASRVKTLDESLAAVRKGLAAYLKLPAKELSKADVRAARDKVGKRGAIMANRFLGYLGPVWRWAAAEDHIEVNFVPDILKIGSESKRKRVLTHAEMKAIWQACDRFGDSDSARSYARMVKFLLTTAQRRDEAASLKHGDILGGIWKQTDNKASRLQKLALPPLALELTGSGEAKDYCFPGAENKKLSGFSKFKKELDKACKVSAWVLHDLRRSAASEMQELGIDPMTISGGILNHAVPGVAAHYLQATLEKPKAEALAAWAAALEKIVGVRRAA